jgi:hypothetical protein
LGTGELFLVRTSGLDKVVVVVVIAVAQRVRRFRQKLGDVARDAIA